MQSTLTLVLAAIAYIAPAVAAPSECSTSYSGDFQITVVKPTAKHTTCGKDGYLTLKLQDGQLIDSKGRLGYIASNYQFQFDKPAQENAASVGGYSICQNSLALAGSSVFYQCLSGDFYNLYDRSWAPQCQPIVIDIISCTDAKYNQPSYKSPSTPVSQIGDGQPQAPEATPRVPVSQIPDGQPQAPAATPHPAPPAAHAPPAAYAPPAYPAPAPSHNETTPSKSNGYPVAQIPDGQPQVPAAKPYPPHPSGPSVAPTSPSTTITAGGSFNKASSWSALFISALVVLYL
ncbi:Mannose-containing glycoprotein [Golovinomyces cichoracearum]|uniref:Mannose-containing glycoprotein n=1 Tax=Golovinomyces cichoracearum TaxID=62708 RepID=A0A420ISZ0_9PEZI|nr:Mannose-containing glycoprotein [Golovinomyces cichoracearum]